MACMIEFRNVSKHYAHGADDAAAVSEFSLTAKANTTTVLVGSSGSGKTTLLRMVNRMEEPTTGSVLIGGKDITDSDPVMLRRSIGYVIQNGGLFPHLNISDNVTTVLRLNGTSRIECRRIASDLLERVGLDPALGSRYPTQLSGGQQQRVGVARALATNPDVLLMDEPFSAVDPIVRRELQDELLQLQIELGKTILFVTHDINEAFRLGDEVVVLKKHAVIAQQGSPAEILSNPADDFVRSFIGADNTNAQLSLKKTGNDTIVVDSFGKPLGVLTQ